VLPAFVIGLREGLETVVILGAIVVFLRAGGRADLLPRIWRASAWAVAICVGIGLLIRYVEVNLPWRQQEQFETVVGLAAVLTVTYMVVWMRRFPKNLRRQSDEAAATALARDSGRALVALAFFAVLKEGFEVTVFVEATIGLTGRSAWLSTGGALLGILAALAVGIGIVKGSGNVDLGRFFRATAVVLVLSAAGIAMTTAGTANAAGWVTFGQLPRFDLSWLAPPGSLLSSFTTGMLGLQPYPVLLEVIVWVAYFVPMMGVVLWPRRPATDDLPPGALTTPTRRRAAGLVVVGALTLAVVVTLAVVAAGGGGSGPTPGVRSLAPRKPAAPAPRVLFASLDGVSCAGPSDCMAVGDFLPLDKDAAAGDPDGDGQATHTLAESFDGAGWSRVPTPDVGLGGDVLSGISCPNATRCVAVGYYRAKPFPLSATEAPPDYPLIESYAGGRWQLVTGLIATPNSVLVSVSCPTTEECVAVGYAASSPKSSQSILLEKFDGRSWTVVRPPVALRTTSELDSVSCASTSSCVAVGSSAPVSDPADTRPIAEIMEAGGRWVAAALPSYGSGPGILYDVRCTAGGECVAVGNAATGRRTAGALVLSLDGSTWSLDRAALQQTGDTSLTALGCATGDECVAAGISLDTLKKVLVRVPATGWDPVAGPATSDNIEAIACVTPAEYVIVGSVMVNTFGNTRALTASLLGGEWRSQLNPVP
jgi:high-affinity iron transporter